MLIWQYIMFDFFFFVFFFLVPPIDVKIINEPKAYKRGSNITLECRSGSSNPESTITWVKQGAM